MQELTPRIIGILQKYMRDPAAAVAPSTALSDLEIDLLDLPMIALDIEDAFNVYIPHQDEAEHFATVSGLIACVAAHLEAKASQPRIRKPAPRSKRGWMTAAADRRR